MFYIQPARILRIVFLVFIWSSHASAEPEADISSLYGNTVEIVYEFTQYGLHFGPYNRRYYVTPDGTKVLLAWPSTFGKNRGTSFGLHEKLCIEQTYLNTDRHNIVCGVFSIDDNLITLSWDSKYWSTQLGVADSSRGETVFTVDGPGQCSFVRAGTVASTSDANIPQGVDRTVYGLRGTCRVLPGRQMEQVDE